MNGECLCGQVRFSIIGKLPNLYQCHCRLCQKQSGTGSNAATLIPVERFQWVNGEDNVTRWKKPTGFNAHFCSTCGCPVPNPIEPNLMWIPVGLLDDVESPVVANLWTRAKPGWSAQVTHVHDYPAMPEDFSAFLALLQEPITSD